MPGQCPMQNDPGRRGGRKKNDIGRIGRPGGSPQKVGDVIIVAHPFTATEATGEFIDNAGNVTRNWTCTVCGRSKTTKNNNKPPVERCPEVKKRK
jgi:hypothetical protein